MINRFDLITQQILNGEYVELDELGLAMNTLCESVTKCTNVNENTFKFIDQILNKNACFVGEIYEKALENKNYAVINYLASVYDKYFIDSQHHNNCSFDVGYFYLDSPLLTQTKSSDSNNQITLSKFLIGDQSCYYFLDDIEFVKKLAQSNILTTNSINTFLLDLENSLHDYCSDKHIETIIYYLELLINTSSISNESMRITINHIIKFANIKNLDALLLLCSHDQISENIQQQSFFSINDRPIETTIKLFDIFNDYKDANFEYFKSCIDKNIISCCNNNWFLCGSTTKKYKICKFLLQFVNYDQEYFKKLLLLTFYALPNDSLIQHLFEISKINIIEFINQYIDKIASDPSFKEMLKMSLDSHIKLIDEKIGLNYVTVLSFCKSMNLDIDYAAIYKKLTDDNWKQIIGTICSDRRLNEDDKKSCYDGLFNFMKNHENYNKEIESFYMCDWPDLDFVKYDIFKIETNELILKVAEYYVANNQYREFKKFIVLYPESLKHLEHLYRILINNYNHIIEANETKHLLETDFYCKSKMGKFFKYFYNQGFNIGDKIYMVLQYTKHFWKYFVKIVEKYDFNINNENVIEIFSRKCCSLNNNDLLAFIDNYNIDHLISSDCLGSCIFDTINSNMIKYFLNRIKRNKLVFDTRDILNVFDTDPHNEIILKEIERVVDRNKKLIGSE